MTVLTDKSKIDGTDVALFVEELVEIYSTPTPKGWHGAKKSKLYLIDWMSLYNKQGSIFIPGAQA